MSAPTPLEGKPPTDEQKQLISLFQELEKNQLDFLDQGGKRIIELTTALLGVLFAVTAFGKDFPPPYLKDHVWGQRFAIVTLTLYVAALFCALWTVHPRSYKRYRHNLSGMREELDKIIANKTRTLQWAGILFFFGSLMLALLIGAVILSA